MLVLCVLLLWSGWLAFLAETRLPHLLDLAMDLAARNMPESLTILLQTFPRWKLVPAAVLTLVAVLILVRWNNAPLRILFATALTLLALACAGMTYLATYGSLSGAEYFAEQFGKEISRVEHGVGR